LLWPRPGQTQYNKVLGENSGPENEQTDRPTLEDEAECVFIQ
jgi:hypothetical protein